VRRPLDTADDGPDTGQHLRHTDQQDQRNGQAEHLR
jgi:hypothetical protein